MMNDATVIVLPRHARVLIFAVLVMGFAAASVTKSPLLAIGSPALALVIVLASRAPRTPEAEWVEIALPPQLHRAVELTMANLTPGGDAQRLLRDVVRQARPLYDTRDSGFDAPHDTHTLANTTDLVLECCDVATQLNQVDELRSEEVVGARTAAARDEIRVRYHSTRELLMEQLGSAASALSALFVSNVEHGTPATDRLSALVTEIRRDASSRSAAALEMREAASRAGQNPAR